MCVTASLSELMGTKMEGNLMWGRSLVYGGKVQVQDIYCIIVDGARELEFITL